MIAESVDVKTRAFRELFKDHPGKVKEIERFHLENGGMSRFDKFRHIYKNILKRDLTRSQFNRLCSSFHKLVIDEVVKAPLVRGAKNLLDYYSGRRPMYIVSGTPDSEIKAIIKKRKLKKYFAGIYGSPQKKSALIRTILKENRFKPGETFFIGDSKNDLEAARETNVLFAGRVAKGKQGWLKSKYVRTIFRDLKELKNFLEGNYA